ncbi:hypothetical protein HPC49_28935 [Pyxidicoccus fallax]|uniref:Lipoprotein n=1 Tax=Pyxidicoccus fallax TaxID=394095 RepID=A0A848LBZ0_9BACT|nr:hypothetical protein [Pyxidicoccus fallax]NMO16570.1 hypothetical protein [Pyxidicoccus fallax]NPC82230.1 hypothetical protein [Pyxidicoccus fallax]
MQMLKRAVYLCAAATLAACGGQEPQQEPGAETATQEAALTQGTSQGCTFNIFSFQRPGVLPPTHDIRLNRAASDTCAWPQASLLLGTSYNYTPSISLAANDLGVAVSFTYKSSPSGSSGSVLGLQHVDPATMTFVRNEGLAAGRFGSGSIYSGNLTIEADGTTLKVQGTKYGAISGETIIVPGSTSNSNYIATYPNFFTSTTPRTVVAY